jgi:primary-amine oxidase
VISAISTVGNYDYGFYWYLYLDGTIQLEVKLTGVLQTAAVAPGQRPTHGTMVAPGLAAPNHQHLFCARLDTEIDGRSNSVYEVDTISTPRGPANPNGNAIVARSRLLRREGTAKRMIDPRKSRCWKIVNRGARNGVGEPVAYKLVPGSAVCLLADDDTSVGRRARFATRSLWVTPYRADERRPAGDYPNQSRGGDGLPAWTAADRPIVDTDVVLWHTFGVSHVARPEDWPVMPVEYAGFTLRPAGFFERNPALDVPPSAAHCHPNGG